MSKPEKLSFDLHLSKKYLCPKEVKLATLQTSSH